MKKPRLLFCLVVAGLSVLLTIALRTPLSSLEEQMTSLKYSVRGAHQGDSAVVLVYVDTDAISDVGWPVRRNFYALMLRTLAELGVKAVGIDVVFEEPSREYPEYDELLAGMIKASGNVVLASYFRTLEPDGAKAPAAYPLVRDVPYAGSGLHQPLDVLRAAAAGVGHAPLLEGVELPLFVQSGDNALPLLAAEVLRVAMGVPRDSVALDGGIMKYGSAFSFRTSPDGTVVPNFPGPISSFTMYPFLEVLKSYDADRLGRKPSLPVRSLQGKIVLIGVIAEGRSARVNTPVDRAYPSVGITATVIENALHDRFLRPVGHLVTYSLTFLTALVAALAMLTLASPLDKAASFGLVGLVLVASFALFAFAAVLVPVAPPLIAGLVGTVSGMVAKQRMYGVEMGKLTTERDAISAELRTKEAKVSQLESELLQLESQKSQDRTAELLEEIRRYKAEIHALSSRADDLVEYALGEQAAAGGIADFEGIVYDRQGRMKPVVEFTAKIAGSESPVLVLGESGTGKELVARAIHRRSARASRPFVAVNCGALAESLLESELFGHEKGAFTGAVKDKPGRFELAEGGTIFLDEIGEVSEAFQVKLLRVLQEGEFERVGGTRTLKTDVRVIAATNKELKEQVKAKRFREDLYYRLNVLSVSLPPLRERKEDIPVLVRHFLAREGAEMRISRNVMDALQAYSWRGNVRELESILKRGVLLARADERTMVNLKDLAEEVVAAAHGAVALEDQILESLREKKFSRSAVSETAEDLGGLNRGTVAEYLRGQCLKSFVDHAFDLGTAVRHISLSTDPEMNERVEKKMREYLVNVVDVVDTGQPWESVRSALRPKMKNLPQRFHGFLEQVAEAYHKGVWMLGH